MKSILIANPKGGSGKTTLATNLAGYFTRQGHRVVLGDADQKQSARAWLSLRSGLLPAIVSCETGKDQPTRIPKQTTRFVLDTPAGLHGKLLDRLLKQVDRVIVPLQPSIFDIFATRAFLTALLAEKAVRKARTFVGVVGMRVDPRTRAAGELDRFLAGYELPLLGHLRDTQLYVQLAAHGMTLFDLSPSRAARDVAQWQGILGWVERE